MHRTEKFEKAKIPKNGSNKSGSEVRESRQNASLAPRRSGARFRDEKWDSELIQKLKCMLQQPDLTEIGSAVESTRKELKSRSLYFHRKCPRSQCTLWSAQNAASRVLDAMKQETIARCGPGEDHRSKGGDEEVREIIRRETERLARAARQ